MRNNQRRAITADDTLSQTLGCRHSNSDICRNHSTPGKCAFVRKDNICLTPPRSWNKLFRLLQRENAPIQQTEACRIHDARR